jgi:uncharacterized membrane protein YjgN (DUF898 family)
VFRKNLVMAILVIVLLVAIVSQADARPRNTMVCTFPLDGHATCKSDLTGVKIEYFEDNSFRVTGCVPGGLCE